MDLRTTYLGLELAHPLVPSASPLSGDLGKIRRLEDAGAPAIVLFSLFEEQIRAEAHHLHHYLDFGRESFSEATSYFPDLASYEIGPDGYLELIRKAKQATSIPIIGSINCVSLEGWASYARLIQDAGADALELNIYYLPTDPQMPGDAVEAMYSQIVQQVRHQIHIPLAVKLHPFFSSIPHTAFELSVQGVQGLVLFNRFYQPDLDLEALDVIPNLVLSSSHDLRLPLRWTAILFGRTLADLAISSGIHTHLDLLKAMMAGAKVGMIASELLQNGLPRLRQIVDSTRLWMEEHEYESIRQMQGSLSYRHVPDPTDLERANYVKVLRSFRWRG